ncbi:DNA polymerase I [Desulfofalx alkaliphila]|uniref:DNA polymerase I n=1 Tax=Desulfofalx alkaliphila TaxID=105483 RepID=UPI0004E0C48D|nr:DNA polymerase I [Desulfofalx alkaliphila]
MSLDTLIVVDGNSLAYRAFHAIPLLTTTRGLITNSAYGFTNMLLKLIDDVQPGLVAVAFDKGRVTFRNEQYSQYKANRKAMPDELRPQFPIIKDILKAMRIPIFELEGYEADDLIGTIVAKAEQTGLSTLIVTGDRDALQLVSPRTKVLMTKRGITEHEIYDEGKVWERFGVYPNQFTDFRGLTGDSSDNIPGVPGIGEKTAAKLLQQYPTLEEVLDNLDRLPKGQREKLEKYREQALLSKKLATIEQQAPIEIDLAACSYSGPDYPPLLELFTELEFRSLIKSILNKQKDQKGSKQQKDSILPAVNRYQVGYQKITKPEILQQLLDEARQHGKISLLLSGTRETGVATAAIATQDNVYYIPVEGADAPYLKTIKELCEDEQIAKLCHDGKNTIWLLHRHGIELNNLGFDTMIAAYLLNPATSNYDLEDLAMEYLGIVLPGKGEVAAPAGSDAINKLVPVLHDKIKELQEERLFYEVELPLVKVLAKMEIAGVAVDKDMLAEMSAELGQRLSSLSAEIYQLAGEEFNINSPKQLGKILFEKLKLPVIKKTKTGYSTDASVLEQLAEKHDIVEKILEHRQLAKLKSTYADGLAMLINKKTKCIHTTLHQTVTATGRLSSAEPNLQNIPIRMELGRRIRKFFVPRHKENLILTADYSQIELRVLAHIAGDPGFLEAFNKGQDIHARTASEVFNVPIDEVTPEMRERSKAVNFGIVYGISEYGLARDIKVSRAEARKYIENYFARCPGVKDYIDRIIREAKEKGYVTTVLNRRRYLPDILSPNRMTRSFGERTAMNTPIQGSAADIIKLAMVRVDKELQDKKLKSKMILQVHDELIFDVPKNELPVVVPLVKECMEKAITLDVPLVVEVKAGPSWYDAKPVDEANLIME